MTQLDVSANGREIIPPLSSTALRRLMDARSNGTGSLTLERGGALDGRGVRFLLEHGLIAPDTSKNSIKPRYAITEEGVVVIQGKHPKFVLSMEKVPSPDLPVKTGFVVTGKTSITDRIEARYFPSVPVAHNEDCANCVHKRVLDVLSNRYPKIAQLIEKQLELDALMSDLGLKGD